MKATTGTLALNLALTAGFEIDRHGRDGRRSQYVHVLVHADGRSLAVTTELGTGRLIGAQGQDRARWSTRRLSTRSVPALGRLLAS